jgi:hypothetical protein
MRTRCTSEGAWSSTEWASDAHPMHIGIASGRQPISNRSVYDDGSMKALPA